MRKCNKISIFKMCNHVAMLQAYVVYFLLSFWLVLFVFSSTHSQDLHFSQFYNSPLSTNPANTGFIPDADYRIGAHFRNQYSTIMAVPYRTVSIFGDAQILRNKLQNGWMGVGGLLLSDVAGSGSLRSTKIYGSLAYHQMLGNKSLLSAGFNLGWVNKRIDISSLKFPDQFDGIFFDKNLPTSVVFNVTGLSYFDMQAGINYAYFPTQEIYINSGYSIHHVNKAKETFFNDPSNQGIIPMRHIGFLNAIFKANNRLILQPNVYYTNQSKSSSLVFGMIADYNLSVYSDRQLLLGLYGRWGDAIIPMAGFQLSNLKFTFSYDATISSLRNFNQTRGAYEFNLIKNGFYKQTADRQSLCPTF